MGALDKLETGAVLAILGVAGYLVYTNYEKLTSALCGLPLNPFGCATTTPKDYTPNGCPIGQYKDAAGICKAVASVDPPTMPLIGGHWACPIEFERACINDKRYTCVKNKDGWNYWEPNLMNGSPAPCLVTDLKLVGLV